MNDIRLISIDMDGTLLDHDGWIPLDNLRAMQEATDQGICVCINTGRMVEDVLDYKKRNGLHCAIAGCNGSRLIDIEGKLISKYDLSGKTALALCDIFMPMGLKLNALFDGFVVTVSPDEPWTYHLAKRGIVTCKYGKDELYNAAPNGMIKIVAMGDMDDPRLVVAKERIQQDFPLLQITSSYANNIEISSAGTGKGEVLRVLCDRLHITPDQVMALGDADNDLSMLAFAGCSVAMGNAPERVKTTCRHITRTNEESGVAYAIRRWALREDL